MQLNVVASVQIDATSQTGQRQVEDELIAPPDVAPLIDPPGRLRHLANDAVEGEHRRAPTGEQAVVDNQRVGGLIRGDRQPRVVGGPPAVSRAERVGEAGKARPVPFPASEDASLGAGVDRGEDRLQVAKHEHIRVKAEIPAGVDHPGDRVENRLTHCVDRRHGPASHQQHPVLRGHSLTCVIRPDPEDDQPRVVATTVGHKRAEQVIEPPLKPRRDDCGDAPLGLGDGPRRGDLCPAEAVDQCALAGESWGLVHPGVEPDSMAIIPPAGRDDKFEDLHSRQISRHLARRVSCLDKRCRGDLPAVCQHGEVRVRPARRYVIVDRHAAAEPAEPTAQSELDTRRRVRADRVGTGLTPHRHGFPLVTQVSTQAEAAEADTGVEEGERVEMHGTSFLVLQR